MLENLIIELCGAFPFTFEEKNKQGFFGLKFGTREIFLRDLVPGVYLKSIIGAVPGGNQEELFSYLMRANYLSQGTGQSVLGVDDEGKNFQLLLHYGHDLNFRIFKLLIEDFVNYAEYWSDEIAKSVATKTVGG